MQIQAWKVLTSKILMAIVLIIGAIIAIVVLTGKSGKSALTGLTDSFGGIFSSNLPTDTAEIAASPGVLGDVEKFHDPTTDFKKAAVTPAPAPAPAPGTYVTAGTQAAPLAFTVVGGVDTTPKTQTLFGDQSGYGGIAAGGGSAGASGSRPGGTGTWTSAGYVTKY